MNTPNFWKTDLDYISEIYADARICSEKRILCQSAGGRPVYMLAYGDVFATLPSCGVGGPMAQAAEAEKIPMEESAMIATDWINGRRTPDANQLLQGTIAGFTLGTTAPQIFRALVEATAFGTKAIVDRFVSEGCEIESVIGIGGIALKSPFVMQTMSDVLDMPIKV